MVIVSVIVIVMRKIDTLTRRLWLVKMWRRRRYRTTKMKRLVVAFDVDGTLIQTNCWKDGVMIPNDRIVTLLKTLASFKNIDVVVWSGGGKAWADKAVDTLDLRKYVKATYSKNCVGKSPDGKTWYFEPDIKPDIAIDDIQACSLGVLNLVVREK